jgi:hypothetical protein
MRLLFLSRCTEPDVYSVIKAKNNLRILISQPLGNRPFGKIKKGMRF